MKRLLAVTILATVAVAGVASVTISNEHQTQGPTASFGSAPPPLCPPFCGTGSAQK
jgi:hypothetical protein